MSSSPIIGVHGLHTCGNQLTHGPGTSLVADNVVLTDPQEAKPRRGQDLSEVASFGDASDKGFALEQWNDAVLLHYGPTTDTDGDTVAVTPNPTTTAFSVVGSHHAIHPEKMRMKFAELAKSMYFNTATGLFGLTSPTAAERQAGVPRPPDLGRLTAQGVFASGLSGNPGTGWMPVNSAAGYRIVFARKDANKVVKLSAPCGRFVVVNPADIASASLTRTGGTTVTATVASHGFLVGDLLYISSAGSSDFLAGTSHPYQVTAFTATTITWTNSGSNVTLAAQTLSSGTKNVQIRVNLGGGNLDIIAGDFFQVYRTLESLGAAIDPGDEEFQCYERTLSSGDIGFGFSIITDTTPDLFLGGALYTNSNTGDPGGLDFEHLEPPLMTDFTVYDGRFFGTQTVGPQTLSMRLLGVGSPAGLQANDLIAIETSVYAAGTSMGSIAFPLYDQGLPSQNIINTANSFTTAYAASSLDPDKLRARLGFNGIEPTGLVEIESVSPTAQTFYAGVSRQSAWQDALPQVTAVTAGSTSRVSGVVTVTTATAHGLTTGNSVMLALLLNSGLDAHFTVGTKGPITVTGTTTFTYAEAGSNATMSGTYYVYALTYGSEQQTNQLRFSEPGLPEAWPAVNFPGGLPDGAIVSRIKTLSGSLYIFLEHGDIYTLSGQYPYSVQKFNGSAQIISPDSLIEHASRLILLSTQGVVSVGPSGLGQLSGGAPSASADIQDVIRKRITKMVANGTTAVPFAVSYESDHQYQLWLPDEDAVSSDASTWKCTESYVFHSDSQEWTRWDINTSLAVTGRDFGGRSAGLIYRPLDLELLVGQLPELYVESKTWGWQDGADGILPLTFNSVTDGAGGGLIQSDANVSVLNVGDVVQFPDSTFGTVLTDPFGDDIVQTDGTYRTTTPGVLKCWRAISPLSVKFVAAINGAPGIEKHWRDGQFHFGESCIGTMVATCTTERTTDGSPNNVTTIRPGTLVIGTDFEDELSTERFAVAVDPARGAMQVVEINFGAYIGDSLTFPPPQAFTQFKLLGYTLNSESIGDRTPK